MAPTDESEPQAKKRKKDRACDACRRRKTKCDGPWMPNNLCTNCIQTRKPCTYVEASKPRGPPKAYVTGLEDRIEALEALLQQIRPDVDFSEELGPPIQRNSWKNQDAPSSSNSATRKATFAASTLPPLLIPFPTRPNEPATPNLLASPSPHSTHLRFHSRPHNKRPRKVPDANLSAYRDGYTISDDDSSSDASSSADTEEIVITSLGGRTKITLHADENDDSAKDYNIRFHGRSSTAGLVEVTRQFKYMHMKEAMSPVQQGDAFLSAPDNNVVAQTRRPRFWQTPAWELRDEGTRVDNPEILQVFIDQFPPPDLAETLIELYFRHSNSIFPLLHRPTFNQQWQEHLHHRNIWFACVCLSIFAVASRWCHDERVLPRNFAQEDRNIDWSAAGRHYFEMANEIHRVRRSLFHPASLFEIQSFTLNAMYLGGAASSYPVAWLIISTGIRKAQDVGAHRKKVYRGEPNVDDELWKRAFWHLVVFDRLGSAILGRSCGLAEEDFDLDLPLEVDDDYWEAKQDGQRPFKQPPGVPSTVTAFNEFIKLTQITAFAMRTLYAVDKSKVYRGLIPMERGNLVKQLSIAMEKWKQDIPGHLQWQDKMDISLFSDQSANLFATYHLTQLLVHRPLITTSVPRLLIERNAPNQYEFAHTIPVIADPAIAICTAAARSCALIIDLQLRQGISRFPVPIIVAVSYSCAAFLLLTTWKLKVQERDLRMRNIVYIKPPLAQLIEEKLVDIKIFVQALEALKHRWDVVEPLLQEVNEVMHGLESQNSDHDGPRRSVDKGRADIPPSKVNHGPWSQMPASVTHPQHQIQHGRFPTSAPLPRDYNPSTTPTSYTNYHPVRELHSFSDTEPVVHIRLPEPQNGSTRPSVSKAGPWSSPPKIHPNFEPHPGLPSGPSNGRARAMSVTAVNAPWNDRTERTLPFISSMRRTSYPNLSQRDGQYSTLEGLQPRTTSEALAASMPTFGNPEVRYEDVNMHFDNESNPRYPQNGHHQQAPPSKHFHRSSRAERSNRTDDWSHPLTHNIRTDRPRFGSWTSSSATPVVLRPHPHHDPHSHHDPSSQDQHIQDPYNPANPSYAL